MKYSVKQLAKMYNEVLSQRQIEIDLDVSQPFDINTYNEYTYQKLIRQFDRLYQHTDSVKLTEKFLKGD
ncbi:MAG: hypothetical protein IJ371_04670 [Clostridia bacterium]|nr:hypothetical protein [Clostridia bacterium]